MAKLTATQKEQFRNAAEWMRELDVSILYSREARMMCGFRQETENGQVYRFYVTLCHKNDEFKKKLGALALCEKLDNDNFIQFRAENWGAAYLFTRDFLDKFGATDIGVMHLN